MPTLHNWQDIADEFDEALLIGNGASIAVHAGFAYASLLEESRRLGLITPSVDGVFQEFATSDFEYILNVVWHANQVNRALSVREYITKRVYNATRNTLIGVVRAIHPVQNTVLPTLQRAAPFLRHFSIIVSLNYDLLLYWAILLANADRPSITFKDCFIDGRFDYDWERYQEPIGHQTKSIPVFYAHGNLTLATNQVGEELKVISGASGQYLLSRIVQMWRSRELAPLFISEGTSEQKLAAIRRSRYLGRVFDSVLPLVGESLVIYGSSLQRNDEHILSALIKGGVQRIAVSVHRPRHANLQQAFAAARGSIDRVASSLGKSTRVKFFDAQSQGAWIY